MRRFRPHVSLFAAYTLVLASVLGALSSASLAGASHLELCVTSAQDGKPLPPVHSNDQGLCCFVAAGAAAALTLEPVKFSGPALFGGERLSFGFRQGHSSQEISAAKPRAPPALA